MVVTKVAMMLIFLLVLSYSWENSPLSDQLEPEVVSFVNETLNPLRND